MIVRDNTKATTNMVTAGMNPSPKNASPVRICMVDKNIGKAPVIKNPTSRKIISGDEQEYAKTARKIEITEKSIVEEIFDIRDPLSPNPDMSVTSKYIILRSLESQMFYLLTLPKFFTQNNELGFEFKYDKSVLRTLLKGTMIPAGTVVATSSRITDQGEWCPGIEAKIAPMSHPDCEEDAILISSEFAKKVGVVFQKSIEKDWKESEYILLNTYGTIDVHKGFPLCGERVREDGVVFGLRPRNLNSALVGLTKKGLMQLNDQYDILFYAKPGSIVSEINVETERYKDKKHNRSPDKPSYFHTKSLEDYERVYNQFYNKIANWYNKKEKENPNIKNHISPELFKFVYDALGNITVDTSKSTMEYNPVKRKHKKITQSDWKVTIKIIEESDAAVRYKMTGMHGNKATIGRVIDVEHMPVDEFGNRADIIVSNFPDFRRQIFTSLMELDINYANIRLYPELKAEIDRGNYDKALKIARDFYETINPKFNALIDLLTEEEKIEHLLKIAKNENEFSVILDQEEKSTEMLKRLIDKYGHFKPTKLKFTNRQGELIETINDIPITTSYYIMLDKLGSDINSQSTASYNLLGLPTNLSSEGKLRNFYRAKLNRNVGATEARIMVNQYGGEFAVTQVTLANSPDAINRAVERIIRSDDPFNIPRLIYQGEERTNASLNYIGSILSDTGIIFRKENDGDRVK